MRPVTLSLILSSPTAGAPPIAVGTAQQVSHQEQDTSRLELQPAVSRDTRHLSRRP